MRKCKLLNELKKKERDFNKKIDEGMRDSTKENCKEEIKEFRKKLKKIL